MHFNEPQYANEIFFIWKLFKNKMKVSTAIFLYLAITIFKKLKNPKNNQIQKL